MVENTMTLGVKLHEGCQLHTRAKCFLTRCKNGQGGWKKGDLLTGELNRLFCNLDVVCPYL